MTITAALMLPNDVMITPIAELAPDVQRQLSDDQGCFAVSRPHARSGSKIMDAASIELINQFRKSRTIVDGVIAYSKAQSLDPEKVLEEAYPLLMSLYHERFLVPEGSHEAESITTKIAANTRIDDIEIVGLLQLLEDTEVHEARLPDGRPAAIKIARRAGNSSVSRMIQREATVLAALSGRCAPALHGEGEHEGRRYVAMELCPGVDAAMAADERRGRREGATEATLSLAVAVAEAYAELHASGVIHGDVHPRNIIVSGDSVRLIDFGYARFDPERPGFSEPRRGGIGFFFEPEYARANHGRKPMATRAGDQYSLAVLLYFLLVGSHYLDFSLERDRMLQQITEDPPRPFSHHGLSPWPEVESVLVKALSKDPAERYADVAELTRALAAATPSGIGRALRPSPPRVRFSGAAASLLDTTLQRLSAHGDLLEGGPFAAPTTSVNYGSAGIAYLLYRVASLRDDARLLSDADLWMARALREATSERAFANPEKELPLETIGEVSIFHSPTGLYCVQALIAHAMGDFGSLQTVLDTFVSAAGKPCDNIDLTLGRASLLLGSSALIEAIPSPHPYVDVGAVQALGARVMDDIWKKLDGLGPIAEQTDLPLLGIAHGWAGFLFATLRFCQATGLPFPGGVNQRLRELAASGELWGRGMRWPRKLRRSRTVRPGDHVPSWCNGSSGFVHLWALAHELTGEDQFLTLAERAGMDTWESRELFPTICCGSAGRAYAALALYRTTGSAVWLERARELGEEAAQQPLQSADMPAFSLYKGSGGVALLAADLQKPESSCLPLFDSERGASRKSPSR